MSKKSKPPTTPFKSHKKTPLSQQKTPLSHKKTALTEKIFNFVKLEHTNLTKKTRSRTVIHELADMSNKENIHPDDLKAMK